MKSLCLGVCGGLFFFTTETPRHRDFTEIFVSYALIALRRGDYRIFVGSTAGKPVAFTLTVKITKMADI